MRISATHLVNLRQNFLESLHTFLLLFQPNKPREKEEKQNSLTSSKDSAISALKRRRQNCFDLPFSSRFFTSKFRVLGTSISTLSAPVLVCV